VDQALTQLGADPNDPGFKLGKLGGEVAGTAGIGGALANGARVLGAAPKVVNALASGGFSTGAGGAEPARQGRRYRASLRGRWSRGRRLGGPRGPRNGRHRRGYRRCPAARPDGCRQGGERAGECRSGGKPTPDAKRHQADAEQLKSGDADVAVQTLLDYGINPTKGGVEKLRGAHRRQERQVGNAISSSNATVDKGTC
jgi:hypothetical protein